MAYIYCDFCGIGFHSNVRSCPECGRSARRSYDADPRHQARIRRSHGRSLREDVEREVRESIYGWRSGTVERCVGAEAPDLVDLKR